VIEASVLLDGPLLRKARRPRDPRGRALRRGGHRRWARRISRSPPRTSSSGRPEPPPVPVTPVRGAGPVSDRIGFRTIEVRAPTSCSTAARLPARGLPPRGEPAAGRRAPLRGGRAPAPGLGKGAQLQLCRLAHYPHNEHMARVADEIGLMLWEEVPVYWTIQWENPDTLANAQAQLAGPHRPRPQPRERDRLVGGQRDARQRGAHALPQGAGRDGPRARRHPARLRGDGGARGPGQTRNHKIVDDPFGNSRTCSASTSTSAGTTACPNRSQVTWTLKYDKPVVISEFGADALQGIPCGRSRASARSTRRTSTERPSPMLGKIPSGGMTPWILCDFRSPRRRCPASRTAGTARASSAPTARRRRRSSC
jgi:beta-glucuronidase